MEKTISKSKSSHLSRQIDLNNWVEVDIWCKLLNCSIDSIFEAATKTDGSFKEVSDFVCGVQNN